MNNTISRMKTIKRSFEEIKKLDPDTAISQWFIRTLCKQGKVKHFMTGTKILVNFDDLINYLNDGNPQSLTWFNNTTKFHKTLKKTKYHKIK